MEDFRSTNCVNPTTILAQDVISYYPLKENCRDVINNVEGTIYGAMRNTTNRFN